jgi:hypothetical protein
MLIKIQIPTTLPKRIFSNGGIWFLKMFVMMFVTPKNGVNGNIWLVH